VIVALCASVLAQTKLSDKPIGAEIAFVQSIQKDLNARFPTTAAAEKAGYFRYTNEDKTGAISYANLQWTSSDPRHPSQLWYDVHGNLLGADFSVPTSAYASAPSLWGINPQRWFKFRAPHVHFVLQRPDGTLQYTVATRGSTFVAAGGDLNNPQPAVLAKLDPKKVGGLAPCTTACKVVKVFTFPSIWDLIVWVKPNPSGAFADANPLVHPSANAGKGEM